MSLFRSNLSEDGKLLSIPADSPYCWIQTRTKTLFVRSCYDDLWGQIEATYFSADAPKTCDGFMVSGTPDVRVGKSCFLDFCLHKLLELRKSVCYFYGKSKKAFIYKVGGTGKNSAVTIEEHRIRDGGNRTLANQVDFLLIDPPEGSSENFLGGGYGLAGKNFVLSYTSGDNCCTAVRKDCTLYWLYMGPCNLEEAEEMRVACYDRKVTKNQLVKRYEEIGGIPRWLFRAHHGDDKDVILNEYRESQTGALIDVVNHPNKIDYLAIKGKARSELWTIYHMEPTQDYQSYEIIPCSESFSIRIRDSLMKKEVRDLWDEFENTREELGALRQIRYEAYAHKKILTQGLTTSAQLITKDGVSSANSKDIYHSCYLE